MCGQFRLWAVLVLIAMAASACRMRTGAEQQPATDPPEVFIPIPAVPAGHPRVYVRAEDLPGIRAKLEMPEFARAWGVVQAGAAEGFKGPAGPMCSAFIYLVNGDRGQGRRAVEGALRELRASVDKGQAGRTFQMPFHWGACVYDWCHDLLTEEEKQAFVTEFIRIAGLHRPKYPAKENAAAVVGHDSEGWLLTGQLPAGVAIHDESRTMYEAAAKVFFKKFVPPRNYHYASHSHHQGDSYGARLAYDLGAAWLFRRMGAGDVFSGELQFVPYHWIYHLRPDGDQIRRGDSFDSGLTGRKLASMILAGAYYGDPYLLGMADGGYFRRQLTPMEEVFDLLLRPAGIETRPKSELPTGKYFPEPMGEMVARSGWAMGPESRDVLVHMRVGHTFFGNHQKRDMGTFQIYYRGPLAVPSGSYEAHYGNAHWNYAHETVAANGLLIHDPEEQPYDPPKKSWINAGGQIIPNNGADHPRDLETILEKGYRQGKVAAHAMGPDEMRPEYAYISGDITRAYGPKAELVTRSMATLFTGDKRFPAVLVVFDRMTSASADFKKTWVLHSLQEPAVDGNGATVICDGEMPRKQGSYGGKLEIRSLLPEGANISKIGGPGKEFWVEGTGTNYAIPADVKPVEAGAWRVEISPPSARKEDRFLTAMAVMDAENEDRPEIRRIDGDGVVGVLAVDRAVFFGLDPKPRTEVAFALAQDGELGILVCDLAGGSWRVERDGREVHARLGVLRDAGSVYFRGGAGRYVLRRVDAAVPAEPTGETFWESIRQGVLGQPANR